MYKKLLCCALVTFIGFIGLTKAFGAEFPFYVGDAIYRLIQNTLVLDSDNSGGNIKVQFGNTLDKEFYWDSAASKFVLNAKANVQGDFDADGTVYGDAGFFQSTSSSAVPMTVKGATSQSADLQDWQNSSGSTLASISSSGAITAANLSGTNTGNQTITLTGDVTGSGTGSFAATIANDAVTFAKFQNITTGRLLGRTTAGSGDMEELTVSSPLALSGGALSLTQSSVDHNSLANLTTGDPHTQYGLLAGRSGGQTFIGGTAASNNLLLRSTSNATKGYVAIDQSGDIFSVGTASPAVHSPISVTPHAFIGDGTNPHFYTDTNGDAHIGDGAFVDSGANSHTSSFKLYFDRRFGSSPGGTSPQWKQIYLQALPNNAGSQNQSKLSVVVDGSEVVGFNTVGAVTFNNGMAAGSSSSWQLVGSNMQTTNNVPGAIFAQNSPLTLRGQDNSTVALKLDATTKAGGAFTSGDIAWFSNLSVTQAKILTNGGAVFNANSASTLSNFQVKGSSEANLLFTDAANNRVGVATGTPGYKLDVNGDTNFAGALRYDGNTIIDTNGYIQPKSSTDAAAPNSSLYYSTDQSKLVYKDSGGTVNNLY